jgi:hypothetical protein
MKVINNRAKSATVFYKVKGGKMKKVKLKPFESLAINELVDINAVKNTMTISNFTPTVPVSLSATTFNVVNPYKDGLSVSTAGSTKRRNLPASKQVNGRFEIKYN